MSEIMIPSRGCVYMPQGTRGGDGFYALQPALRGPKNSPILIEGADAALSDSVFPVPTLDDKNYLYVMGRDFTNISISGVALLGKAELNGRSFRIVKEYFEQNRSSSGGGAKPPITVSMPGDVAMKFYLTGIAIGRPDPQFHIQAFQLRGSVAEPTKR